MAYPHKRHRFQKFIVFLFAIVIILLVSYFVALPKIKTKATGIVLYGTLIFLSTTFG